MLPYLGPAAARREQSRPAPAPARAAAQQRHAGHADPLQGLPMRLTYRTMRVLGCIQEQPGASNRQVAEGAGVQDQGQISKLLRRLEGLGAVGEPGRRTAPPGEPNAWHLTSAGERIAQSLRLQQHVNSHTPTSTEERE